MKDIHKILSEVGLSVPEDKKTEFDNAVRENYKTVAEVGKITAARDNFEGQLNAANATLKKFEGIDPEKINETIQTYKTQAEKAEKKFISQLQNDWIEKKLDEYGVKSPYARRQLAADCMSEDNGLKWKDGAFFGFDDFMKSAKEKDAGLYQTAEEKAAAEKEAAKKKDAPTFTGPAGDPASDSKKYTPPVIF